MVNEWMRLNVIGRGCTDMLFLTIIRSSRVSIVTIHMDACGDHGALHHHRASLLTAADSPGTGESTIYTMDTPEAYMNTTSMHGWDGWMEGWLVDCGSAYCPCKHW